MTDENMIRVEHVSKEYRLGAIGGTTLREDLQRWNAKLLHKEDPTLKIGQSSANIGQRFMALNDVSFDVKKGEAVGIIGHNGAGKSTLLKLLSRVTAPTEGTIYLNGRIASMLEVGTGFHPELTGRENIYMNGAILGMTKSEIDSKIEQIIDFSECRKFIDTPVKRYSSGMYVKLAFSVAAHLDSEIMIMDEVLAVGDMKFQQKCLDRMSNAANYEGRTILYVSHNMNTIRQLCTRCIVMDHGKVVFNGDTEKAIEIYMGMANRAESHYEYTMEHRSKVRHERRLELQSMDVLNWNDAGFCTGETLHLRLRCSSKEKWNEVMFRAEVQYQDGTIAGTMLSGNGVSFLAGEEKYINLDLDTTHLMPGRYKADLIAYVNDRYGNEDFLDGVYPGLIFNIRDQISEHCKLKWLHRFWGHVKLHDLTVSEGSEAH